MGTFKTISLTGENGIWTLTVNRPEALNALNSAVVSEMSEAIKEISVMKYHDARVLIITGAGPKAFVAGADIKEISELGSPDRAVKFVQNGQNTFYQLTQLKIPVIAAVNGFALGGGCELALACDFIVATENAKFGLPEVSLGLIPGFGGTIRLSQAVGLRRARELTYTADMWTAQEALAAGLVNHVVAPGELMTKVRAIADKIIARAPVAVGGAKKSINGTWDLPIAEAQKLEASGFGDLFNTGDVVEGTKAFLEKRKPNFNGA